MVLFSHPRFSHGKRKRSLFRFPTLTTSKHLVQQFEIQRRETFGFEEIYYFRMAMWSTKVPPPQNRIEELLAEDVDSVGMNRKDGVDKSRACCIGEHARCNVQ